MTKEFTSQDFEIEFTRKYLAWLEANKEGPNPRGEWEFYNYQGCWTTPRAHLPDFYCNEMYRWKHPKKRTVPIGDVELVAPEVKEPAKSTNIFVELAQGLVQHWTWDGGSADLQGLANGKVFLTREDCQAMADAQRAQRLGENHGL